jgi:hypothetical protein
MKKGQLALFHPKLGLHPKNTFGRPNPLSQDRNGLKWQSVWGDIILV